jgi:aryl-alcohol dehydrogenase-like predicted oxidoreductase
MYRGTELDVLPVCDTYGLGLLPWSPLAAGLLSGKYSRTRKPEKGTRWAGYPYNEQYDSLTDVDWQIVETVADIAEKRGVGSVQVACAWLLSRKAVSSVLGGARTVEQMKSYITAADVTLTLEEIERLDRVSAFKVTPSEVEPRPSPRLRV